MIRLDSLSIHQGAFRLTGVVLEVPSGRYGVMMGKTGCGKTKALYRPRQKNRPPTMYAVIAVRPNRAAISVPRRVPRSHPTSVSSNAEGGSAAT